jgi:hypothetical protein
MHVNAKIILIETILGMGGGEIKDSSGGGEFNMMYLMHCKSVCKCHNVLPAQQ